MLFSFFAISGRLQNIEATESIQVDGPATAELLSEGSHIPGQNVFRVGVKISAGKGNHIYWKNPGGVGSPLSLSWNLPKGFSVQEEHWPAPKVFEEDGITFFGYEDSVLIVADIFPSPNLLPNQVIEIQAQVEWLACGENCLPGYADLSLSIPYKEEAVQVSSEKGLEFARTLLLQPRILENNSGVRVARGEENEIILNIPEKLEKQTERVWFISEKADKIFTLAEVTNSNGEGLAWKLKAPSFPKSKEIQGVLLFADKAGDPVESLTIRSLIVGKKGSLALLNLWHFAIILVMAFLGGLFLNIMPCVLPLVTLKVYGLIKSAGEHRSCVIANGLWFTFGVVGCFWGLAGVASLLKVLGHNIGWGFQLQEPMFVAALILIFFLFALSSLGLFEVGAMFANLGGKLQASGVKSKESKSASAFFNGILATLVTTPCTGPFLGSILGLVMSISFVEQLLIFSAIGLGMASPYLVFSIFPKMLAILPKPGEWMSTFKQIMGFMLLGTVTWLVWIFGAETSTNAVVILLIGLWLAGIGAWMFGRWGSPICPKKQRYCVSTLFLASIIGSLFLSFVATHYFVSSETITQNHEGWQSFSSEKLAELRKQGRSVFVNFTAKWCLTCQMNKPLLHSLIVQKMFEDRGIVMLEADWTRKDPEITEELSHLGRASVPSYVFYPNHSDPILLPEKLSMQILEEAISIIPPL